jgi:uncharacterized peroxidase-related enzyme
MATNYEKAFAARPEVYDAWVRLNSSVKAGMDQRRYELVTLAAARRLRSSYCALAHGKVLLALGEPVRELALDHHAAGLDEADVAIMDLAEKVVEDATSVDEADRERLRGFGLSDADILSVVLAASARCFFSKTLDAVGAQADADYRDLPPELREVLAVGRPIADA